MVIGFVLRSWFNKYSARVMSKEKMGLFKLLKSIPKIKKSLNRLREKGYDVKSVLDIIGNDNNTSTIVYTSKYFQPYSKLFQIIMFLLVQF